MKHHELFEIPRIEIILFGMNDVITSSNIGEWVPLSNSDD